MTDKSEKLTIHDVAREAGVAISTVSRVMNGLDRVSPATRKKVRDAIQKLNFYPNSRAQALSSKKTGMIALLVPDNTTVPQEIAILPLTHHLQRAQVSNPLPGSNQWPNHKIQTPQYLRSQNGLHFLLRLAS